MKKVIVTEKATKLAQQFNKSYPVVVSVKTAQRYINQCSGEPTTEGLFHFKMEERRNYGM